MQNLNIFKEDFLECSLCFSETKVARLQFEKEFILRRLTGLRGNVSKTADAIGIERSHLYRKLRLYGIDVKGEGRLPPQKMETK